MSYRERYAEIVKAGRRESKNIGQKAQNAVIDTFALMDDVDAEIAALTEKLRAVEAERDEAQAEVHRLANGEGCNQCHDHIISLDEDLSALRAELERKDAALKIYQARAHRNANSTCDGCPFAVAERDVNWADRPEGYYTCGLDNKERWGEDPKCPEMLYKEPPCQTA